MRLEYLNGSIVPYDLSFDELVNMLHSSTMKDFCLACEALSEIKSQEAYKVLKQYLYDKDKYKRLYVLKIIFKNSLAVELTEELEKALLSDDILFVEAGLFIVKEYNVRVKENILKEAIIKNFDSLSYSLSSISVFEASRENFDFIVKLYEKSNESVKFEIISETLYYSYGKLYSQEIFDLISNSKNDKARYYAAKLAIDCGFDITQFQNDKNGHIRKLVKQH